MIKAVIVSDKLSHCRDYCYFKHLNRKDYKFVCNEWDIQGLPRDIPVIITYCSWPLDDDFRLALFYRFDDIYLEDY